MNFTTIHPFPARMAPELAHVALGDVPKNGRVLDPMCGSGTVARAAVEAGLDCVGVDIDPLAVLMSRVWTSKLDTVRMRTDAEDVVREARSLEPNAVWRTEDAETQRFISYWFARKQEDEMARMWTILRRQERESGRALAICLSRLIVSKEMMASLARDTSHSRPHKVANRNEFDVYEGFLRSCRFVARRLNASAIRGRADIRLGDARKLEGIDDGKFDLILTSPPYLNAIDYIRAHRLTLVWLGYAMASLRQTRATSVGAERMLAKTNTRIDVSQFIVADVNASFGSRQLGWIRRYAEDMEAVLREIARVVKPCGMAVMVLGNSFIRGARIDNAGLIETIAREVGFGVSDRMTRKIPARRRYLPPPGDGRNALDARMRTETVVTFRPNGS